MKLPMIIALLSVLPLCGTQKIIPSSVWSKMARGEKLRRKELIDCFVDDCIRNKEENRVIPAHTPNTKTFRIATYNIHLWRQPHDNFGSDCDFAHNQNFTEIMETIKDINADVFILQEMLIFDWKTIREAFEKLGYECTLTGYIQTATFHHYPFGNMILTKAKQTTNSYTLKTYNTQFHKAPELRHGFLRRIIELPNKKKLVIYGTHLDVHDDTENVRQAQVQELIENVALEDAPCIVAADFNAIRAQDYHYIVDNRYVWDLLNEDHIQRNGFATPTKALDFFQTHGFFDCFSRAHQQAPKFSVWNGTLVDFMWLNKQWNLPIIGCYIYYSTASDHLPIIMDIQID